MTALLGRKSYRNFIAISVIGSEMRNELRVVTTDESSSHFDDNCKRIIRDLTDNQVLANVR